MWKSLRPSVVGAWSSLVVLAFLAAGLAPRGALAAEAAGAELPLSKVVMFTSGVSYFEHRGAVRDDASIDLKFKVADINDLLKSLVLEDLGGGRVSTISYGSKDPVTKTLQTFAIDLTSNPTLGQILNQARGERVRVTAPNEIEGVILGVETRRRETGKDSPPLDFELLNLLTDSGLRSVPLDAVGHVKLLNEKLDAELRKALLVLATSHANDKKTVTLNFLGKGERPVRLGYIQETPIWQTSYRLVLNDGDAPYLQGWAMVENTTEDDWNKVNLTLVSGRPISFVMDLYQPLYIQRPLVQPETFASLRPQTYSQDLGDKEKQFAAAAPAAPSFGYAADALEGGRRAAKSELANRASKTANGMAFASAGGNAIDYDELGRGALGGFGGGKGQSTAQGSDVGELFQYTIATPITLPRQQSAMLPIVNESAQGEKVSIYNAAVQPKHPLCGLRLKNSTNLHLMQGPLTVFDGGVYAGDAKIEDLPPGAERLLSYALDLDTEVTRESKGEPQQMISVRISKGTMFVNYRFARSSEYRVKNSGKKAKKLLIEQSLDPQWTLLEPKQPTEKTRDLYRFAVQAEPGKPAKLIVAEERSQLEQVLVTNLDDSAIGFYLQQRVINERVKAALAEANRRKQAIQSAADQRRQLEQQITTVSQEQDRIRQNMGQLDRNTDLYKKYVTKFSKQEDDVERLRGEIKTLVEQETLLRKSLDEFLNSLELS
jgi:hypothetical protein